MKYLLTLSTQEDTTTTLPIIIDTADMNEKTDWKAFMELAMKNLEQLTQA